MAGRKKSVAKKAQNTNKAQSETFKKVAKELEADGDLNLTEAEEKLEKTMKKVAARRSFRADDS